MASMKCLLYTALVFTSLASILYVIGFATPNWVTPGTQFLRLGLWEACFNSWTYHKDYTDRKYEGCLFLLSDKFSPVWKNLNRSWFSGTQVILTLNLVMEIICLLFLVMYVIGCCPGKRRYLGIFVMAIMQALIAVMTSICLLVFGLMIHADTQWLERKMPPNMDVSWSFAMVVLAAVAAVVSDIFLFCAAIQARRYRADSQPA